MRMPAGTPLFIFPFGPPTPTSEPKAAARFISGKVSARPEMASGPTPWPMKMLSTML